MTADTIHLPFSKKLYLDLVRLSDGRFDPASHLEDQVLSLVEFLVFDGGSGSPFEARAVETARIYFDHRVDELIEAAEEPGKHIPLIWKEVSVPAGTEVRMQYSGSHHYARIKNGMIHDEDGDFTPSEWASKIANGTARNAWRDLWFKQPMEKTWVPAELLRDKARAHLESGDL